MKKYSHAWLAFMAIKHLEETKLSTRNRGYADHLIRWFKDHKDDVIQGAWYPDAIIKDMASSHVLKFTPLEDGPKRKWKKLPTNYLLYQLGKTSPVRKKSYEINRKTNLPDRCESLAHSIIDNMKMQQSEEKGSSVAPTGNHVALRLFMLSHYIADAHMPFHCDSRQFSEGAKIHARVEKHWDDTVKKFYQIDTDNERFYYDKHGYPMREPDKSADYKKSFLKKVEDELAGRKFSIGYGNKNKNIWDFMDALCQNSYLVSYRFIPEQHDHTTVNRQNWKNLGTIPLEDLSAAVFADAIESIARAWFRVWRRYVKWVRR